MERILALEKGEIVLSEEKITIRDKEKRELFIRIASSAMWTFYGSLSVINYMKTGNEFLLWSGIIVGPLHLVIFLLSLFRTAKVEVHLQEISMVAFKKRNGNNFLDLKLKSGKKRRISKIEPVSDQLRAFFLEKKVQVQ